jgi:hypothetical protein
MLGFISSLKNKSYVHVDQGGVPACRPRQNATQWCFDIGPATCPVCLGMLRREKEAAARDAEIAGLEQPTARRGAE